MSVPSANDTSPVATTIADPELDPPAISVGIERVAARAVVRRPRADEPGGELVEVGLAHEHRARGEQLLDHRGRAPGHVGELGAPGGGRHAGDVDVVLHRERHPRERKVGAGGERGVDLGRARPQPVGRRLADPRLGLRRARPPGEELADHRGGTIARREPARIGDRPGRRITHRRPPRPAAFPPRPGHPRRTPCARQCHRSGSAPTTPSSSPPAPPPECRARPGHPRSRAAGRRSRAAAPPPRTRRRAARRGRVRRARRSVPPVRRRG